MNFSALTEVTVLHPEYFLFVLPVVLLIGVAIFLKYRSERASFTENPILRFHAEGVGAVRPGPYLLTLFGSTALIALLTAVVAEPIHREVHHSPIWGGVRVTYLIDVSLSMKYGHDVPPYPDRLFAAKSVLSDFAEMTRRDTQMKGKYSLALIPFAGEAMTYLAFSKSREEFIDAIDNIDETTITARGTSMHEAFRQFETLWNMYPPEPDGIDIVVLLTDGGKGEGNRADLPGIKAVLGKLPPSVSVYTVGIGSVEKTIRPDGTTLRRTIPVELSSLDKDGKLIRFLLEDEQNPNSKRLMSELDEEVLEEITLGRGKYFYYEGKDQLLNSLKQEILAKRKLATSDKYESVTPVPEWFLWPALFIAFFQFGYARRTRDVVLSFFRSARMRSR